MRSGLRNAIIGPALLASVLVACSSTASAEPAVPATSGATLGSPPASSRPAHAAATAPSTLAPSLAVAGSIRATITGVGPLNSGNGDYYGIAAGDTDVWVYDGEVGTLSRIAARTDQVVATVKLAVGCQIGRGCGNVALGEGAVWVANVRDGTITRVDATSNKVIATIRVGDRAAPQVFATPGAIWSANYLTDSYSRIDPMSNKVSTTLPNHGGAESVAFAFGSIWLCDASTPTSLTRLSASTLQVIAHVDLSQGGAGYLCLDQAATDRSILVAAVKDGGAGGLFERVDPTANAVSGTASPPGTAGVERGLAATATQGWLIDARVGLFGLDPQTAQPRSQLSIPSPAGLTVGAGSVWVVSATGSVYRITPAS